VLGVPTRFATGGPMKRDYTHVFDCCDAILLALDASRWPQGEQRILNVAAGQGHTAAEVAALVRDNHPRRHDRDRRYRCAARSAEREDARAARRLRAKLLLGWSPKCRSRRYQAIRGPLSRIRRYEARG